jgi:hypothetical protein
MSLRRSEETKVVEVLDEADEGVSEHEERCKAKDPYEFSVATRVEEITSLRVYFAWACIIVPRLIICMFLAVTGVRFIGKTHSVDDLVLNCVAIAFVMDFDEIAFEGFTPRRLQTLMNNMKPIPCIAPDCQASRRQIPVLWQVTKILLVLASALALYYLALTRFFWQLEQVDHILCSQSSSLDFVYARNNANNIIYVARSQDSDAWTPDEVTMMKVANLEIESRYDWKSGILDKMEEFDTSSDAGSAIVIGSTATSVGDTEYDAIKYEAIVELGSMSLEQAASSITCRDLGSSKERGSYLAALQVLMENTSIESCDDVSWHYCTRREMSQLRALCPVRCNCHVPPTYVIEGRKAFAGYFQSPQGGCPQSCQKKLETSNEISFVTGESPLARGSVGKCTDLEQDEFFSFGSADCLVDKTVAPDCSELPSAKAFWWLTFVAGLFEHLTADVAFRDIVSDMVMQSGSHLDVPSTMKPEFVEWVSNGSMAQSLLDGTWDLMPGVPHPRGLKGCAYLTSFEVRSLLNTDLCSAGEYSSIRFMCPVSCGCTLGKIYETQGLEVTDRSNTIFQVSNRMEDLGSCPAECVMVHPSISNDTSYDSITCTAHDDCGEGKFCSAGACSACDECHYCWDGIDGTCGSYCDGPTQEIGPCLTPEIEPTPACSDTSGGATGVFASQAGGAVSCDVWAGYAASCAAYSPFYDDSDFTAVDMCCACGGGGEPGPTPPATPAPPAGTGGTTCADTDGGALDSYGDPCQLYVTSPGWCYGYDDTDFTSSDMCCACGGGEQ